MGIQPAPKVPITRHDRDETFANSWGIAGWMMENYGKFIAFEDRSC